MSMFSVELDVDDFTGEISQITRSIYVSDWEGSLDIPGLKQRDIRAVLCLNMREKPAHMIDKYIANDIRHKQIFIADNCHVNMLDLFPEIISFIEEETTYGSVLVHCTAGISRSPTAVAAYLLRVGIPQNIAMNTDFVINFIKSKRIGVDPNHGFMKQLKIYDQVIHNHVRS